MVWYPELGAFRPERTLSVRMLLYFLQGEHRHISLSEDFDIDKEQGTRDITPEHPVQDIVVFRRCLCNRKSRAFSSEAV